MADVEWDLDGIKLMAFGFNKRSFLGARWLLELPVPCTVIIDNTDLATIRTGSALPFPVP